MYNPNIKDFPIIPNLLTFVAGPTIAASGSAVTISSNLVVNANIQVGGTGGPTFSSSAGDLNINRGVFVSSGNSTGAYVEVINTNIGGKNWGLTSTGTGNPEGAGSFVIADNGHSGTRRFIITSAGAVKIDGNFLFITDALYSIGSPSSGRPQSIYLTDTANAAAFQSVNAANIASAGILRVGNNERLNWRNFGNSANLGLRLDTSNIFQLESSLTVSGGLTINGNLLFTTDALYSIGTPSSGRPQNLYLTATANAAAFQSVNTANIASAGIVRVGNNERFNWRNFGNTADLGLRLDASNIFQLEGPIQIDNSSDGPILSRSSANTLLVANVIRIQDTSGPALTKSSTNRLNVLNEIQINSGPILSNNSTALEVSGSLIVDGVDLTIGAGVAAITLSSTSNILEVTGSGYANIFAPGSTSRAGLAAGGSTGVPDDYGQRSIAIRNTNANGGHFYPIMVGGAIDTYKPLRTLRGRILGNGATSTGEGFTVIKGTTGLYTVSFNTAFLDTPAITVTCANSGGSGRNVTDLSADSTTGFQVNIVNQDSNIAVDSGFSFIAIGLRDL